ncbi:hypothetical protein Tco_0992760 [Tanacetum coccineum]|uniref:DUF641 domain-containing protein n=1 Tax=Tanacetum coccineum TaxID=301880 RepID=A0ABQ5F305_9ASTR
MHSTNTLSMCGEGLYTYMDGSARFVGSLANSSDSLAPDVEEDHAPHNMIYGLHCYLLKDKLGYAKLKNDLVSLKSKKSLLEHEMSKLEDHLAKAQRNQNVEGSQVVKDLRFENDQILEEVSMVASLEKAKFVRDFLPSVVKKLFESEHFNQALGDLQQKAITYGRSQALHEVHGLGDSWDFKDVQDYHPEAKKLLDEAAEAFYKLKFP